MSRECLAEPSRVQEVLEKACALQAPARLQRADGKSGVGEPHTAGVRLIALEPGLICTDLPRPTGRDAELRAGQEVQVCVTVDGIRWCFASRIEERQRVIRLADGRRLMGMALGRPEHLDRPAEPVELESRE